MADYDNALRSIRMICIAANRAAQQATPETAYRVAVRNILERTEETLAEVDGGPIKMSDTQLRTLLTAMAESMATCSFGLEYRDAVTCSDIQTDGTCHNHKVIAGLRQHAVDADRFELENRQLRQSLTAAQGIIHEGLHGGKPTDPSHQEACEKPACQRIRKVLDRP